MNEETLLEYRHGQILYKVRPQNGVAEKLEEDGLFLVIWYRGRSRYHIVQGSECIKTCRSMREADVFLRKEMGKAISVDDGVRSFGKSGDAHEVDLNI